MVNMIATLVEYKRDLLLERQREGIELAKKKGKYKGRKPAKLPDNYKELLEKHFNSTVLAIRENNNKKEK